MLYMLGKAATKIETVQPSGRDNARRLRVLLLFLRYTGLRISGAVKCSIDRLVDGKIRLYTQKTGAHVHCPLPEFVVKGLGAVPMTSSRFWFWSGNGKWQTAVGDWQGRIAELADEKVKNVHAHRFRDTFAVELLLAGTPIERVAVLLGNYVKIAEKHYAPWVRERQEQAEADVRRTWAKDPVAAFLTAPVRGGYAGESEKSVGQ